MNQQNIDKIKEVFDSVQNRNLVSDNVEQMNLKVKEMWTKIGVAFSDIQKMCGELNQSKLTRFESVLVCEDTKREYDSSAVFYLTANHNGWGCIKKVNRSKSSHHQSSIPQSTQYGFSNFVKDILHNDIKWTLIKDASKTRKRFLSYLDSLESIKDELLLLANFEQDLKNWGSKKTLVPIDKPFYVSEEGEYMTTEQVSVNWYYEGVNFKIKKKKGEEDDEEDNVDTSYYRGYVNSGFERMKSVSTMILTATYKEELEQTFEIEWDRTRNEEEHANILLKKVEDMFAVYYLSKSLVKGGE